MTEYFVDESYIIKFKTKVIAKSFNLHSNAIVLMDILVKHVKTILVIQIRVKTTEYATLMITEQTAIVLTDSVVIGVK